MSISGDSTSIASSPRELEDCVEEEFYLYEIFNSIFDQAISKPLEPARARLLARQLRDLTHAIQAIVLRSDPKLREKLTGSEDPLETRAFNLSAPYLQFILEHRSTDPRARRVLGEGAFGVVSLEVSEGERPEDRRLIAVKEAKDSDRPISRVETYLAEKLMAMVEEGDLSVLEHLPEMTYIDESLLMEYIPENIEFTKKHDFDLAFDIALATCKALSTLKTINDGASVIHRDIKSENLGRKSDGKLALYDLGLADLREERVTRFKGTLRTSPPEVIDCESKATTAIDSWSIGSLIYTALTGGWSPMRDERPSTKEEFKALLKQYRSDKTAAAAFKEKIQTCASELRSIGSGPHDALVIDLMEGFLEIDPSKRLLPSEALLKIEELSQVPRSLACDKPIFDEAIDVEGDASDVESDSEI